MAAEIVVVIAKIVLGLAPRSGRTKVDRQDAVVVDADPEVIALDRRDRDSVRRGGPAASLGDFESQRDRRHLGL
jgi:hypothetical protein